MYLKMKMNSPPPHLISQNSQPSICSSTPTAMSIKFCSFAFLTLLLFCAYFSATSIQDLLTSQEKGDAGLNLSAKEGTLSVPETETEDLLNELMGMEVCHGEDEECLARRMMAEAHLDYIYTQRHRP
uniref:Phytosulfokine n=1 Tax=Kalanchoe fedtschenkoi TaxID=63787 RepID=A0A7N0REL9_KALFE